MNVPQKTMKTDTKFVNIVQFIILDAISIPNLPIVLKSLYKYY